jgi:hypothetical protein
VNETFIKQNGDKILLDVSKEACLKFGFRPGQAVKHLGAKGIVLGVAPAIEGGSPKLWIRKDRGLVFISEDQFSRTTAL